MCTDSLIIIFIANSDLTARKHFGSQDRGDATEANGFILSMECLQHSLDLLINRAVLPLFRPCTQILCRTKTPCKTLENSKNSFKKKTTVSELSFFPTWEYNCIVVFDTEIRQVLDVSTGQSCTLHQYVSLLLGRISCQVVYHMHLLDIRRKHVHL